MSRQISWGGAADGYEVGDIRPGYADSDDGRWMVANGRRLNGSTYPDLSKKWFNTVNTILTHAGSTGGHALATNLADGVMLRVTGGKAAVFERSTDGGVTWTASGSVALGGGASSTYTNALQFVNGRFFVFLIAVDDASNGLITTGWAYSTDGSGTTWSAAQAGKYTGVAFGNAAYVFGQWDHINPTVELAWTADLAVEPTFINAFPTAVVGKKSVFFVRNHNVFYAYRPGAPGGGNFIQSGNGLTWTTVSNLVSSATISAAELGRELAVFDSATGVIRFYYTNADVTPTQIFFAIGSKIIGPMSDRGDWLIKRNDANIYLAYAVDGTATYRIMATGPNISFGSITGHAPIPGGGLFISTTTQGFRAFRDPSVAMLPAVGSNVTIEVAGALITSNNSNNSLSAETFVMKVKP